MAWSHYESIERQHTPAGRYVQVYVKFAYVFCGQVLRELAFGTAHESDAGVPQPFPDPEKVAVAYKLVFSYVSVINIVL